MVLRGIGRQSRITVSAEDDYLNCVQNVRSIDFRNAPVEKARMDAVETSADATSKDAEFDEHSLLPDHGEELYKAQETSYRQQWSDDGVSWKDTRRRAAAPHRRLCECCVMCKHNKSK